jgi:hypothetical protein
MTDANAWTPIDIFTAEGIAALEQLNENAITEALGHVREVLASEGFSEEQIRRHCARVEAFIRPIVNDQLKRDLEMMWRDLSQ